MDEYNRNPLNSFEYEMQHALIVMELNIFQKKQKIHWKQKYHNNIYKIQAMCGYFCMGFIDFMLKRKFLLDETNLFSPKEYEKNDKRILHFFQ